VVMGQVAQTSTKDSHNHPKLECTGSKLDGIIWQYRNEDTASIGMFSTQHVSMGRRDLIPMQSKNTL